MRPLTSFLVAFLLTHLLSACSERNLGADLESINLTISEQEAAWNNGDLRGFMNGYWMSDSLRFSGGKTITYGWEPALNRYQKSYDSKEKMGHLRFSDLNTKLTSDQSALSTGAWVLERQEDTLQGRFTLVWSKINGSWVIIADHSS